MSIEQRHGECEKLMENREKERRKGKSKTEP